jgi:hypothetical protein
MGLLIIVSRTPHFKYLAIKWDLWNPSFRSTRESFEVQLCMSIDKRPDEHDRKESIETQHRDRLPLYNFAKVVRE